MSNSSSDPIVVIGNGMAGLRLLQDLREAEGGSERAPVVAIGAEPMEAYNRVLLSSLLSGESEYRDIALVNRRWYDEQDIELQIGVRDGARLIIDAAATDPKHMGLSVDAEF